jgi:hypothetical protein
MAMHKFEIEIEGYTRQEAEQKLNVLMEIGGFTWNLNPDKLVGSVFTYWLISKATQQLLKKNETDKI